MAYLTATRYGLTHIEPTEQERASGWRQVWEHPSGLLAMRHPVTGYWVIGERGRGIISGESWASSLRGAARMIERELSALDEIESTKDTLITPQAGSPQQRRGDCEVGPSTT